jgi:hypothetical protein
MKNGATKSFARFMLVSALALFAAASLAGCRDKGVLEGGGEPISFATEYQAVFMDNGQTFFGRMEGTDTRYPMLTDVFYIQSQVNEQTREVKNILIKRGNEWHSPDRMYLNERHIVVIEPVSPNSQVARLIKEAKAQNPAPAKQ